MPIPSLDVDVRQQFADQFSKWRQGPLPPVVEQVRRMEAQRRKAVELLGEILATLLLEGNQHVFKDAPEDWHTLVKSWRSRYSRLKTEGDGEVAEKERGR